MASKTWKVAQEESGLKLLNFLQLKLGKEYSLKKLKHALESNLCLLNGRVEHFAKAIVGPGDQVVFNLEKMTLKSPDFSFPILYEDEDFLFIDKPAGIPSESKKIAAVLERPLELAHRLDKETSGVLAFSQSVKGKKALYDLFKRRHIDKSYLTIVAGMPTKSTGHIETSIGVIKEYEGQKIYGTVPKEQGLLAITDWKCLKKDHGAALLLCHPVTGRTHQIRVHLASMGHPILGDRAYNKLTVLPYMSSRCLLHAVELRFMHPFSQQLIVVNAPLPTDFKDALTALFGGTCGY